MLRYPGGLHEWLMVARADKAKGWGIGLDRLDGLRTPIGEVSFVNPPARHGGPGSVRTHHELLDLLEASAGFEEFKARLGQWADRRVTGGAASLPPGLRSGGMAVAPPAPMGRRDGVVALWAAPPGSAAEFAAYLAERYSRKEVLLPLSAFARDSGIPWYDHDFLETDHPEEGDDLVSRLNAFSYAASFAPAALESAQRHDIGTLLALYDPPEPPPRPRGGLTLLGCFPYEEEKAR